MQADWCYWINTPVDSMVDGGSHQVMEGIQLIFFYEKREKKKNNNNHYRINSNYDMHQH